MNFDQVFTVQSEVREPDLAGGASVIWKNEFTARASVLPVRGTEMLAAQQLEQITTHRVRMRHHPRKEVSVAMRLVWESNGGKVLNIISCPDPGPRATMREIIAQEGGAV